MNNQHDADSSDRKEETSRLAQPRAERSGCDQSYTLGPIGKLAAALAKAQATTHSATRTGVNPHYGSKYADLASIWAACRESLTSNGLAVVQMPGYDPLARCVSVTTILLHESGEHIVSTVQAPVSKTDPQGVGSAITYLRRYALAAFAGVAPDDDDGEAASRPSPLNGEADVEDPAPQSAPLAVWPIGKTKGTPLQDLGDQDLEERREWCVGKNRRKYAQLIRQIDEELAKRGFADIELAS